MSENQRCAQNLIAGKWTSPSHQATSTIVSPNDGEVFGYSVASSEDDASHAIQVARSAFEASSWRHAPRQRASALLELADRIASLSPQLVECMSHENGKLHREAEHEVQAGISELRFYAGLARSTFGRMAEIEPMSCSWLRSEPLGVAGVIVPWNAPVTLLVRSLAPAMAAGCSVVVKPAEQTALTNALFMRAVVECKNIPPGIVNSVNGGVDVSKAIVASPLVDVISYTGSTKVGKEIMSAAANTLKRLNLELGGSAPCLVLADADVELAVAGISKAALAHAGQVCMAASRVLIHESIFDEAVDKLATRFDTAKLGVASEAADLGPVINPESADRVQALVERGAEHGEIVVQGKVSNGQTSSRCHLSPSIVKVDSSSVDNPMVNEEVFGPAITVDSFNDIEEGIVKANRSRFGLCASVWTGNLLSGQQAAMKIDAGTVWINNHMRTHAELEAGGFKESGIGRLHGVEGLLEFMQTKNVAWSVA